LRQDYWRLPYSTQLEECLVTPVRVEAQPDVFGTIAVEKVEAA